MLEGRHCNSRNRNVILLLPGDTASFQKAIEKDVVLVTFVRVYIHVPLKVSSGGGKKWP